MPPTPDYMLILTQDLASLQMLRSVASRLGCEPIEASGLAELSTRLLARRPTIAVLAVDSADTDVFAVLHALVQHDERPVTLLVGAVKPQLLTSARRAAALKGLPVIGTRSLPLDELDIEQLLTPHVATPPPISRQELEQALAHEELLLHYLPKISLGGDAPRIQGVEALIRWQHPRRGQLRPWHFLQAVETHGLLVDLTDYVITAAVRQAGAWRSAGMDLQIVINLSPRLVKDHAFPDRLGSLLREYDVPATRVILDITETAGADNEKLMLDVFTHLRLLGVGLALDNFGTGLSSLMELYRMPFSEIKVDHALLAEAPKEREADVIVRAIANLAHALDMTVCAEGVESREMLEYVRAVGFDCAEGRLFSGPVRAIDIERLVRTWPDSAPAATGSWRALASPGSEDSTAVRRLRRPREKPTGGS